MSVNKSRYRSCDDLAVFMSLAVAIGILVASAMTIWLCSII